MLQCLSAIAFDRVKLEEGIEIHELDACTLVNLISRHLCKEFLLSSCCVLVAVAVRHSEKLSVLAEKGKVASPGVDADGFNGNAVVGY